MSGKWISRIGCVGALACLVPAVRGGVTVTPDKENVVASRLAGKWLVVKTLTTRLTGGPKAWMPPGDPVEFTNDPTVAQKIPEKYEKALKGRRVYMAGMMTMRGKKHPFILIELKGNCYVCYFRERDGDPMGDAESFIVMLAVAKDRANDLLFTGGDFNNQPFSAFERADRPQNQ